MKRLFWMLGLLLLPVGSLGAQELADRIATLEGDVRLSYRTKAGVCGDGRRHIHTGRTPSEDHGRHWCEPGPARMTLTVHRSRLS